MGGRSIGAALVSAILSQRPAAGNRCCHEARAGRSRGLDDLPRGGFPGKRAPVSSPAVVRPDPLAPDEGRTGAPRTPNAAGIGYDRADAR